MCASPYTYRLGDSCAVVRPWTQTHIRHNTFTQYTLGARAHALVMQALLKLKMASPRNQTRRYVSAIGGTLNGAKGDVSHPKRGKPFLVAGIRSFRRNSSHAKVPGKHILERSGSASRHLQATESAQSERIAPVLVATSSGDAAANAIGGRLGFERPCPVWRVTVCHVAAGLRNNVHRSAASSAGLLQNLSCSCTGCADMCCVHNNHAAYAVAAAVHVSDRSWCC
jgi:hypothetical protein